MMKICPEPCVEFNGKAPATVRHAMDLILDYFSIHLREGPRDHDHSAHTKNFRFRSFYGDSIGHDLKSL